MELKDPKILIGAVVIVVVIITSGLVYIALTPHPNTIIMYTTTSTDNSGLLDYLKPMWEKDTGITVDWVPVGTGAAINASQHGEADLVMVHARTLEDQFVADGYGMHRVSLMHNDFVMVGPSNDPAGINGLTNATQVFENLISNAIKFSPPHKAVKVILAKDNGKARAEIIDEGPGLTEEDKKKVFGKFQRLSAKPTGGEHSTGLGLSIVKKYVEAMNGKVWCESEHGKGANFIVEFNRVE